MRFKFFLFSISLSFHSLAINVQQYSRSHSLTYEMIEDARLENSHVTSDYKWILNLGISYVDSPLTVKTPSNSEQLDKIINGMWGVHFGVAYNFKKYLQVGVSSYFSQFKLVSGEKETGLGDIDLKAKIRLLSDEKQAFTLMPQLIIPSNGGDIELVDSSAYSWGRDTVLSDGGLGYGARLIYERLFKRFQLALNLGILFNSDAKIVHNGVTQIDYTKRLQTGFGVYIPMTLKWGINLEYMRHWSVDFFNDDINQNEFFAGSSFALSRTVVGFAGVGLGNLFSGSDGNDYRGILGVKVIPHKKKELEVLKERPAYCYLPEAFTILFENDKATVGEKQRDSLLKVAKLIKENEFAMSNILIHGHTSSIASQKYNMALGKKRALFVKNLLSSSGVSEKILQEAVSEGEDTLLRQGKTEKAHKFNRRVELLLNLKDSYQRACL